MIAEYIVLRIGILFKISSKIINNLFPIIDKDNHPINVIKIIEIIITLILITLIGWLSLSFIGKRMLSLLNSILKRIPILRTIYSALGQMTETFTKTDNKKNVVLVEYPRKGSWAVGFATRENSGEISDKLKKNLINVFVPTTPNPTSGFLLMYPKEDVIYLDLTFEEASKFIVSAGTSNPD